MEDATADQAVAVVYTAPRVVVLDDSDLLDKVGELEPVPNRVHYHMLDHHVDTVLPLHREAQVRR